MRIGSNRGWSYSIRCFFRLRNEFRNHLHRTRTEKRDHRNNVLKPVYLYLPCQVRHPRAFQLKHPGSLAAVEQPESPLIVEGHFVHIEGDSAALGDHLCGFVNDGQRLQPQEVHFQKADVGDGLHGVLGYGFIVAAATKRHEVCQFLARYHNSSRMGRSVSRQALQLKRYPEYLLHHLVAVVQLFQLRLRAERILEGNVRSEGDEPRHSVHLPVRIAKRPPHVANSHFRAECAEGNYLSDVRLAVFPNDVINDLVSAVVAQVNVYVGEARPFGVDKPLEREAIFQGVNVGNPEKVANEASDG